MQIIQDDLLRFVVATPVFTSPVSCTSEMFVGSSGRGGCLRSSVVTCVAATTAAVGREAYAAATTASVGGSSIAVQIASVMQATTAIGSGAGSRDSEPVALLIASVTISGSRAIHAAAESSFSEIAAAIVAIVTPRSKGSVWMSTGLGQWRSLSGLDVSMQIDPT